MRKKLLLMLVSLCLIVALPFGNVLAYQSAFSIPANGGTVQSGSFHGPDGDGRFSITLNYIYFTGMTSNVWPYQGKLYFRPYIKDYDGVYKSAANYVTFSGNNGVGTTLSGNYWSGYTYKNYYYVFANSNSRLACYAEYDFVC